jgi:hypothetical protein
MELPQDIVDEIERIREKINGLCNGPEWIRAAQDILMKGRCKQCGDLCDGICWGCYESYPDAD